METQQTPSDTIDSNHNRAYDSPLTRWYAQAVERVARPLNEHIYGPITETNHLLGVIAANATLTAPRLGERFLGNRYIESVANNDTRSAVGYLALKTSAKLLDGLDGAVTRANGTTTLFGAGFDPLVDMFGTYDDGRAILKAFSEKGIDDSITTTLIHLRTELDITVMLFGGIITSASALYAEKQGAIIPSKDKPGANTMAKAKFGASLPANALLLATPLIKDKKLQTIIKRTGQGLLLFSTIAGTLSLVEYGKSTIRNIKLGKSARKQKSNHQANN